MTTALPTHCRKLLIFVRAAGGEIHIGPQSRQELARDYELDALEITAGIDYLSIVGMLRRDGTRLREVAR